jgi:RNA polymerase sigma-70 factor (ECF subfamily)
MNSEATFFQAELDDSSERTRLGALETPKNGTSETVAQTPGVSDEQLLIQIRDGDREPLATLFRRHARAVRNIANRILRNEAEADDLLQEVFVHIFHKAALFDATKGAARSWIFHVTYHRAFDRRRYLNSRHFYISQELEEGSLRMTDPRRDIEFHQVSMEDVFGRELTKRLNSRLSHEQLETIRLYFFEGHSLREIAELTGRPLANVRNHYYRGLERLRKFVLPEHLRSK